MLFRLRSLLGKIIWSLAPIGWGLFTWFMAFGPGAKYIMLGKYSYQFNIAIRAFMGFSLVIGFFGKYFNNSQSNTPFWFDIKLYLIPWRILIAIVFLGIGLSFFFVPLWQYEALNSIVLGVLLSACIEELIAHSIFVKYPMKGFEFVCFNLLSSISFAFMHMGYSADFYITKDMFIEHIAFSFLMGSLAYETKRIELPIICHMLSNLSYTFTAFIFGIQSLYLLPLIKQIFWFSLIVGCNNRINKNS